MTAFGQQNFSAGYGPGRRQASVRRQGQMGPYPNSWGGNSHAAYAPQPQAPQQPPAQRPPSTSHARQSLPSAAFQPFKSGRPESDQTADLRRRYEAAQRESVLADGWKTDEALRASGLANRQSAEATLFRRMQAANPWLSDQFRTPAGQASVEQAIRKLQADAQQKRAQQAQTNQMLTQNPLGYFQSQNGYDVDRIYQLQHRNWQGSEAARANPALAAGATAAWKSLVGQRDPRAVQLEFGHLNSQNPSTAYSELSKQIGGDFRVLPRGQTEEGVRAAGQKTWQQRLDYLNASGNLRNADGTFVNQYLEHERQFALKELALYSNPNVMFI